MARTMIDRLDHLRANFLARLRPTYVCPDPDCDNKGDLGPYGGCHLCPDRNLLHSGHG